MLEDLGSLSLANVHFLLAHFSPKLIDLYKKMPEHTYLFIYYNLLHVMLSLLSSEQKQNENMLLLSHVRFLYYGSPNCDGRNDKKL